MMTTVKRDPKDKYVLFAFLGFFGIIFLVNGFFIYTAISTQTGLVTEQAYEKGLDYNEVLDEAKSQPVFQDEISYKSPVLSWKLKDESGQPVLDAKVAGHVIRPVQDGYDFDISLVSKGAGLYESDIKLPLKGQWVVKLESQWIKNNQNHSYKTTYHLMEK